MLFAFLFRAAKRSRPHHQSAHLPRIISLVVPKLITLLLKGGAGEARALLTRKVALYRQNRFPLYGTGCDISSHPFTGLVLACLDAPRGYGRNCRGLCRFILESAVNRTSSTKIPDRGQKPLRWSRTLSEREAELSSKKGHAFSKHGSAAKHPSVCLTKVNVATKGRGPREPRIKKHRGGKAQCCPLAGRALSLALSSRRSALP